MKHAPFSKILSISLPGPLHEELKREAERRGVPVSWYCRDAMARQLAIDKNQTKVVLEKP
jgi:hypothetical protein